MSGQADGFRAAFNLGMMAGYEVPVLGPSIVVLSAIGSTILDVFDPPQAQPRDEVTADQLEEAMNQIISETWEDFRTLEETEVKALAANLRDHLANALHPERFGAAFKGEFQMPNTYDAWNDRFHKVVTPVDGDDTRIFRAVEWIKENDQHRLETLALYMLTVDVFIQYCRLAIMWEFNLALRDHDDKVDALKEENKGYATEMIIWRKKKEKGLDPGPKPTLKGGREIYDMLAKAQLCHRSGYAELLRQHLHDLTSYAKDVMGEIDTVWSNALNSVASDGGLNGTDHRQENGKTIYWTGDYNSQSSAMVETVCDIRNGVSRASAVYAALENPVLSQWSYSDLQLLKTKIGMWEKLSSDLTDENKDLTPELD